LHLIGSADLMARNLDKRVEVLTPLVNPRHQEWLDHTFDVMLAEGAPSFEMRPDASWERTGPTMFEPHPQREMYEWASKRQTRKTASTS